MSEDTVQGARDLGGIQRVDEQTGVSDLPPAAASHETPELILKGPTQPRRLLLKRTEPSEVTLILDQPFDGSSAQAADQLVLQVCDAHVETESFHIGASEVGAEAGPLQTALEVSLLCGVTKAGHRDVKPMGAEPVQETPDVLRTPNRHDGNALSVEVPTAALGESFQRELVADPFNEHDRAWADIRGSEERHHPSMAATPSIPDDH